MAEGLILYYDFDKDEGEKVADLSGNGNHGKVNGAKWTKNGAGARRTAKGWVGGAYVFDGENDSVHLPVEALENNGPRTIALWLKGFDKGKGVCERYARLIQKGGTAGTTPGFGIAAAASGGKLVGFYQKRIESEFVSQTRVPLNNGKWYHVAMVFDRKPRVAMYLDGEVSTEEGGATGWSFGPGNHCCLGKRAGEETQHFAGTIDEVMIFNRALPDAQIKQLYKLQGGK